MKASLILGGSNVTASILFCDDSVDVEKIEKSLKISFLQMGREFIPGLTKSL